MKIRQHQSRQMIRVRFCMTIAVCVLVWGGAGSWSIAHPFGGVFQKTYVYPMGPFIMVDYQTHIGRDVLLTLAPDSNGDMALSRVEKKELLERLSTTLVHNIEAAVNGVPLTFTEMGRRLELENQNDFRDGINSFFEFRLSLPVEKKKNFIFRLNDKNFMAGELDRLNYFHGIMGGSSGSRLLENGRGLEICFGTLSQPHVKESATALKPAAPESKETASESDILSDYFIKGKTGPGVFLLAIMGAFILGAGHAASPGHGKALVAAYLVGSQGKIRHAFLLGIIVTVTHVAVVFLLGVASLVLSDYFMPRDLLPWLGGISGVMIFIIGYWMLAGRALRNLAHAHGHHHHEFPDKNGISIKGLLSMGIAGGIVPCPSALVVLLLSLSFHRVAEGLGLIFFFSLGLAAVLILIGVLMVTASKFVDRFSESRAWIQKLPVFSAGCIMIIGIGIVFNSFLAAGIIQIR